MKEKNISILNDIETDTNLVVGQKFNGFNERIVIKDGKIRIFNHSGSEQTDNVPHLTSALIPASMDVVICGEGYAKSGRIEDAKSIFGSGSDHAKAWQAQNGEAKFTAVDIIKSHGEDLSLIAFSERRKELVKVSNILTLDCGMTMNYSVEKLYYANKRHLFDTLIAQGAEGVVVKNLKSASEKDWFKVKRIHSWDVVIMGFTEARHGKTGKFDGMIGAIRYGCYDSNGNLRELGKCSGMMDAQRIEFTVAKQSFIGRVIEIKGDGIGNQGAVVFPRFVRMRDDKPRYECLVPTS
jgi:ATP-dependent DNA ligase